MRRVTRVDTDLGYYMMVDRLCITGDYHHMTGEDAVNAIVSAGRPRPASRYKCEICRQVMIRSAPVVHPAYRSKSSPWFTVRFFVITEEVW